MLNRLRDRPGGGRLVPTLSRRRALQGGGVLMVAGAAAALIVLLQPGGTHSVVRTPGGVIRGLGGSGASDVADKSYPRLYSVRLNIDVAIKPGDGKTPPVQPVAFQYPHTAPLGQSGNTYLYAHDRAGMFLGLHNATIGDVIVVAVSPTRKLYFQITEIHGKVAWNDLEWLQPSSDVRLTLQTCNYSGDYDPRFVIVSKLIGADQAKALIGDI